MDYDWPEPWPEAPGPLRISELALRPAAFVEIYNASDAPVAVEGRVGRIQGEHAAQDGGLGRPVTPKGVSRPRLDALPPSPYHW